MTEAELSRYLTKQAQSRGWLCFKLDASHRGFPDKILIRAGKVVFVEVKNPERHTQATPLQVHMHGLLKEQGMEVHVVCSKDDIDFL